MGAFAVPPNNRRISFRAISFRAAAGLFALSIALPAIAQDDAADGAQQAETAARDQAENKPVTISERPDPVNILITVPRGDVNQAQVKECEDSADAGTISGDIIVCRQIGETGENYYSGSREAARKRYAEETAFKGENTSLDVSGSGIFRGPATISGACIIPPCPPEAALLIDVEALPQAPEGSDADRIARGLPPLGQDAELSPEEIKKRREKLGLPPPKYEKDE